MKFTVHVSMILDDIEAENEDEACIKAAEMFDFGTAMFEVEPQMKNNNFYYDGKEGQIKNCSVADEREGDVYAEDIEDEIHDLTNSH